MKVFIVLLISSLSIQGTAMTMAARSVTLRQHPGGHFWLMRDDAALVSEALLVGATEAVVDQIEALNTSQDYTCDMKYRATSASSSGGYQDVMVYGISNCQGRAPQTP